jgi:hypothetical protein
MKRAFSCPFQERAGRQRNRVKEKTMNKLRELTAAVVLTFVLALSAFASQTDTPPCSIPEPGQTDTPPCATQIVSGDMNTRAATGDLVPSTVTNETSFTRIAADVLLSFLPLF